MHPLVYEILLTLLYSSIGILMAAVGFKIVDILTPGNLKKDLVDDKHMPLAVIVASMILGICIIIASVLVG